MFRSRAVRLLFACLVTVLLHQQAFACTQDSCSVGPPYPCAQVVYDNFFEQNCSYWVKAGYVYRVTSGTDDFWEFWSLGGTLYQEIDLSAESFTSMDMMIELSILDKNLAGTERMYIEIVRASDGVVLETVDVLYASTTTAAATQYWYPLNDYSGQDVRLRFRAASGTNPGSAIFQLRAAYVWGYY